MNEQHTGLLTESEVKEIRQQAHEHIKARQWSLAGEAFLKIVEYDAKDEDALYGVGRSLDALGRYEALCALTDYILKFYPDSAQGFALKARALQKLERISEATIANDQALLLNINLPLAWVNRSGLQLLQQKFPEALRSAQRATELAPDDARAWANKGMALFNAQRLIEALEAFDRSMECDPHNLFTLQMRGETLCRLGRMKEVIANVQRAIQINPNDKVILIQAAQALRSLEMYNSLKTVTAELIKQEPDSLFAWENYMRACRGMGLYEEAQQAAERVLELDPSNIRFWTLKADTLYRLRLYREAVKAAELAVQLDPDYSPARRIHEKAVKMMYQKKEKKRIEPVLPPE